MDCKIFLIRVLKKVEVMSTKEKRRGRPPKSDRQKEVIRQRIIASARELFLDEGFEKVSMRKIAVKARCTPTTLYHYFRNKRHILHFLWEELFQQLSDSCMEAVQGYSDPLSRIRRLMTQYIRYWLENRDHYRVIFMIEDLSSPPDEDVNATSIMGRMQGFQILVEAIEQGCKDGLFFYDDMELIWQILSTHVHGIVSSLITVREIQWRPDHELIESSIETTLRGLLIWVGPRQHFDLNK